MHHKYILRRSPILIIAALAAAAPAFAAKTDPANDVPRLDVVSVEGGALLRGSTGQLSDVTGTTLQAGRRTEVVLADELLANRAVNVSRQVFARIPGANFWENDGTGVQLGIATRGLNPNRSWEFNVRQNGYDISSDVFGYPEAYYTPPMEAVERVDFIRGASALQFGPQFGGLLNFHLKHGPVDRTLAVESRQTFGSYGLFNTFNSVGGTSGATRYYGAFQHRRADGWRDFGDFEQTFILGRTSYAISPTLTLHADVTWFGYELRQPAGLTDAQFAANPRQSVRARNWFAIDWFVPALTVDWKPSEETQSTTQLFWVRGSRDSVGILSGPNVADPGNTDRSVLLDDYSNLGIETRLRHDWQAFGATHTLATGARAYLGRTDRAQGAGTNGSDANFTFTDPTNLDNDFEFETRNLALFAENLFRIGDSVTVTPGVRFERIEMEANGDYRIGGGPARATQNQEFNRSVVLPGLSASWQAHPSMQLYGGIAANYRALHFNDIRVTNPVQATNPNAKDSTGWVAEAGVRGGRGNWLRYDVGVFEIRYNDRFGTRAITPAEIIAFGLPGTVTTLRTNIADARTRGIESYLELDVLRALDADSPVGLSVFNSTALINSRYLNGTFRGNRLELAPAAVIRTGSTLDLWNTSLTLQHSSTSRQFSDAGNTIAPNSSGTNGQVPAYEVWDFSIRHRFTERFSIEGSINNLLDEAYFTRRAGGYPGPGIVPAEGRTFSITAVLNF